MGGVVQGLAKTHRANEGRLDRGILFARVFTRDVKMAEINGTERHCRC